MVDYKVLYQQFSADKGPFKRQSMTTIAFIIITLAGCFIADTYRVNAMDNYIQSYNQSVENKEWLESFDFEGKKQLAARMLSPVKFVDVEAVQQNQIDVIRKNGLTIININKGNVPAPGSVPTKNNKKMLSTSSTATITGNWSDMVRCLNEFERKNLVVINGLKFGTNNQTGNIDMVLKYDIYYQ